MITEKVIICSLRSLMMDIPLTGSNLLLAPERNRPLREQRFPGSEQMLELHGGPVPLRRNSDPSLQSRLNRKIATGGGIWLFRRVS